MIGVEITGTDELAKLFNAMPEGMRTKVLREGLKDAGREVRKIARQKAPKRSGLLRKNIKMVSLRQRRNLPVSVIVGITRSAAEKLQKDAKKKGLKPYWWVFQEFGWTDRKGRRHVGKFFLRHALQAVQPKIERMLNDRMQKYFDQLERGFR